jgi:NAD-dependent DNA ligase
MISLDDDGQPVSRALNRSARIDRAVDELIGFLKGVIADDEITDSEVIRLGEWVLMNEEVRGYWPVNVLSKRIDRIFADRMIEDEERADLRGIIYDILGTSPTEFFEQRTGRLPLSKPAPEVIFDQNMFVFTGRFLYGTRKQCQQEVLERGGRCSSSVTLQTSYLVLGDLGSEDWAHSIYGRKIETAIQYTQLCPITLISEEHWVSYLLPTPAGMASA